ncbi:hypothetical protein Mgra_00008581 [Meloidogyne graminicola]|uniref:Uncharacterized protein n=1 Tax=Meloidogyne graminicola TaxID=189291 RepID=A0A8S9ZFH5_9BILA|nr:hypothetical protein Mgra_00008581 [Meloidogyne graminicola]
MIKQIFVMLLIISMLINLSKQQTCCLPPCSCGCCGKLYEDYMDILQ